MYKDPDKQREANKQWMRRSRAKNKDSALSGSKAVSQNAPESSVVDEVGDTLPVIPSPVIPSDFVIPVDVRLKSINMNEPIISPKRGKPKPQSHNSMMVGYVPPKD